jgi:hypothetical protein
MKKTPGATTWLSSPRGRLRGRQAALFERLALQPSLGVQARLNELRKLLAREFVRIREQPKDQTQTRSFIHKGATRVAPTVFSNEPFGENVEGLSHCRDESCVIEAALQKHDFENSTLCRVISRKPLLAKCLRKFKNFRR